MTFLFDKNDVVIKRGSTHQEGWISKRFLLNDRPFYCVEYPQNKYEWLREEEMWFVGVILDPADFV